MSETPDHGRPSPGRAPGERRRLDRAPGERYAQRATPGHGAAEAARGASAEARRRSPRANAMLTAVLVAGAGAALFFLLGLLDVGIGMVAVAAFVGLVTGVALIWWGRDAVAPSRSRLALAAALAAGAIVAALAVEWAYSLVQGGVLGPLDYAAQRYGVVAPLAVAAAALVAAARAR